MYKILLIGDSLSMVRPDFGIGLEETYAYILQSQLNNSILINASVRANSSQNALSENYSYETLNAFNPDLIIYFLGVVDCMPRLFSRRENLILRLLMSIKFLKGLGQLIISYRSKRRYALTKKKLIQYVPIESWNENLEKFQIKSDSNIIFVNIPCPGHRLLSRNYRVEEIVNSYNARLSEQAKKHGALVIDFHSITKSAPSLLLDDGYHISIEAHKLLSELLLESINNVLCAN